LKFVLSGDGVVRFRFSGLGIAEVFDDCVIDTAPKYGKIYLHRRRRIDWVDVKAVLSLEGDQGIMTLGKRVCRARSRRAA
jgi:hypothetical protein